MAAMSELQSILHGLSITCPSLTFEQLLALDNPSARFEAHVPAESGPDIWIYTVDGHVIEGDAMVIRARLPIEAETRAQEGLRDTIAEFRKFDVNTGLQSTVEVRGAE